MYPKREMRESIEAISSLIIIQETATIPPAAAFVFSRFRGFPSP